MEIIFFTLSIFALYSLIFALPSQLNKISKQLDTIIELMKETKQP